MKASTARPPARICAPAACTFAPLTRGAIAPAMVALIVVLGLALASCAGERDREVKDASATDRELLARASAALHTRFEEWARFDSLAYADLAAARDQLGLPEDTAIPGPGKRRLVSSFAARPLFRFEPDFWFYGRPRHPELRATGPRSLGPLGDVLDTGAIQVVVGTSFAFSGPLAGEVGPGDVPVLRTRQPFHEIAERLRRGDGYEETPDGLLVGGEPFDPDEVRITSQYDRVPFRAAGGARGGVIVFGGSPRAARAALQGADADMTAAAELLSELRGVARVAGGAFGRCGVAFGLGEAAVPREGQLQVVVVGRARPERVVLGGIRAAGIADDTEVAFAEATADDERASVRFRSTDPLNATRLPLEDVARPYECP